MIVLRHLKASPHKLAEWLQFIDRYLTLTPTAMKSNLKTLVQTGKLDELIAYAEGEVTYVQNALVPKVVATGYLLASFAAFLDEARSIFWLDLIRSEYDPDWRYLEQILHSMPTITFFRSKVSSRLQEKSDLVQHVHDLEDEIVKLKREHAQEITELIEVIVALNRRWTVHHESDYQVMDKRSLEGRKIAVVGDDIRQPAYRALLERAGAHPLSVPGFSKLHAGMEQLTYADGVIFVTAYSSHSLYYALKAQRSLSTTVFVNQCGIRSFENGISELAAKLTD